MQRVAVKITLPAEDLEKAPLLVGLSCTARVDVSDTGGVLMPASLPASGPDSGPVSVARETPPENAPLFSTTALDHDFAAIDEEIEAIIRSNAALGAPAAEKERALKGTRPPQKNS